MMMNWRPAGYVWRAFVVGLAMLSAGCMAQQEPAASPESIFLSSPKTVEAAAEVKRYRFPTPGSGIDSGGAVVSVNAPLEKVLDVVQDYRGYVDILPRIEESQVMGSANGETDVYMRAPILGGLRSIWALMRFSPPEPQDDGGYKIDGRYMKGNLKTWRGAWVLQPDGPDRTTLRLELFVDVNFPVPESLVTPELMWAADKGVSAVRELAEGSSG